MQHNVSLGKYIRLMRLFRHAADRLFIVPLDHSITTDPITPHADFGETLRVLSSNGVDAIVLHKGRSRCFNPAVYSSLSLIVHLSASTAHAPDPNAKRVVSSVEEALALGADAVSVHVNIGSSSESDQLWELSQTAKSCELWGIPLLAMMYPRGAKFSAPYDPSVLAHLANIAADVGADLVKIPYPGSPSAMERIASSCPIPILIAGGDKVSEEEFLHTVSEALVGGASGVAAGRNVFLARDPGVAARKISALVHSHGTNTSMVVGAN